MNLGQEDQKTEAESQDVDNSSNDLLENLSISEDLKKELDSNKELTQLLAHNVSQKREANAEAKKFRQEFESLKKKLDAAESEKLKEQGEYKKLYEESLTQIQERDSKIKQVAINNKVSLIAQEKGIRKASYLKMFDTKGFEVGDNLEIDGLEEAFEEFYKENPDLFKSDSKQAPSVDSGKPALVGAKSKQDEYKELERRAKTGNKRDIARFRDFKKQYNN